MRKNVVDFSYQKYVLINKSNNNYDNNKKITDYFNSYSWQGQKVCIVCGGESLQGFDFNKLKEYKVITVNLGFLSYSSDINYSMDSGLYNSITKGELNTRHQQQVDSLWEQYKGVRSFITPLETKSFNTNTCCIKRIREIVISQDLNEGIYGGRNSAFGAMMLAIALGSTEIYLLGLDLKCQKQSHFHSGYDERDLQAFNNRLLQYKLEFEHISPLLGQKGIRVFNCNPNSELKSFPFTNVL